MDTRTFISLLIQKLQDLLAKEAITACPTFEKEVQKAIKDLQSLEQNQSLQDSEEQDQVLSVQPAVYSAKDIIDSLLRRKEFQLQPTRKGEINGFKKVVQYPFTCFKASHIQDLFTCSHDYLEEKKEAQTVNKNVDVLIGFNHDSTSSYFLNEHGRERQKQLWERTFKYYLEEENNFVGQQMDDLVALLKIPKKRSITKEKLNSSISSSHDQSSEGTEKNPAEQDGDQPTTQVNSEAGKQDCETNGVGLEQPIKNIPTATDGDQSTKVNDEDGKAVHNHSDCKNSDRDDKSRISTRSTCEGSQSRPPEKIFFRRVLNKKVIITLLQSLIDFLGDDVPEQASHHSTIQVTTVVSDKKMEAALEQDSNDSTNQATAINEVAGVDSSTTTQNHSDHQPPFPHSSDHPRQEIVEENSKQDNDHPSNRVTPETPEETDDHSDETEEKVSKEACNGNSTNQAVAVIGEAGSGKSTLVRTMYNRFDAKRHFTERAWVRVSSESTAKDVLLSIVKQTKKGISDLDTEQTVSEEELMWILKESLEDRNYLIVIEDVETPQLWRDVRNALNYHCSGNKSSGRDGKVNHGGRIIITSRKDNATLHADSTLRIRPLNNKDSWELFLKKVQFAEDAAVKRQFEEKILELCGGLPLGIVLLGGLFSTKEVTDWSRVIEIAKKTTSGDRLALLCYQDLPSEVKPCFLYMALFPKEYEIPVRRIIHLWCAEGFVTTSNSEEMVLEDRAELYFQELVIRNMVQVRWRLDGNPITCRMHDHLHDIFSKRAVDEGFFYLDPPQSSDTTVKQTKPEVRRLASAYHGNNIFPSSFIDLANLRSSIVFDTRVQGTAATEVGRFLNKIIGKRDVALLKVLDLEGVYKPDLEKAVEKLKLLSYLGLRSTFIHSLPDSIGNLLYLETLDLKHTKIRNFPSSIWKAKKLQHLYLNSVHSEIASSSFSESPSNLRTLWGLCIKDDSNGQCDFLPNLKRLRKLGLRCLSTSSLKVIPQLTELQSLKVKCVKQDSGSNLQLQSMEKNENLREVYLMAKLEKSVIDVSFLPCSLRVLTLCESGLEEDPMPVLGQLEELKILRLLKGSYKGGKMRCRSGGFPKLHVLRLWGLDIREGWTVELGAMPCLRVLEISRCEFREEKGGSHPQKLTGLEHLTALKELVLEDMKDLEKEVEESLQRLKKTNVICNF